ncbi:hypothetical protein E4T47_06094 [Aureobasidium subglaciale]|nr:hypothetical protein E4T47_06094 [Aureobasidium subglaciale]
MSSDSDILEAAVPSDSILEKTLRQIVRRAEVDPISVKRVRNAAEERLGLEAGFFKDHDVWNEKSKEIIEETFNEPSQKSPSPEPTPQKMAPAPKSKPTKRTSATKAKPAPKRQKRSATESGSEHSEFESEEEKPKSKPMSKKPSATTKRVSKDTVESEDEEVDDASDHPNGDPSITGTHKEKPEVANDLESEMSVVLDEPPPKKARRKSTSSTATKTKPQPKAKASKVAAKPAKEETPDEAEIKRLQGWLVKCGVRKMWFKELAPYDTPKAKIKHLKEMLKDAGMDGRYSEPKAKAIKERRELEADLEAVQEGAKQWGNEGDSGEDDESEAAPRPQRRAAATRFVDFGEDDDDDDD